MACGSVLAGAPEAVARPGQISSFTEGSPMADCLATGRSVSYSDTEDGVARWARPDRARQASARAFRFHSMMMVPVRARGITLGLAMFVRHQRAEPFQDDDLVLAEEIVARAAVCIDNARRYTREHATALTLQNSLLQRRQPDQRAVEVATRYLPAHSGVAVGGDWFDVIRLSGSRVGLVVGDVVGHGVHAAATMGRLRTAVRTLADVDLEPEELLTRLDDVVTRLADEEELATGRQGRRPQRDLPVRGLRPGVPVLHAGQGRAPGARHRGPRRHGRVPGPARRAAARPGRAAVRGDRDPSCPRAACWCCTPTASSSPGSATSTRA